MRSGHTNGVHFAVWAPNALRVSVAGDFNNWDGRMHPMEKHEESGIFELFIPQVKPGDIYKYEIKLRDGLTYLKADPFANAAQLRPDTASVVANLKRYAGRTGSGCAPGKTCKKKTGRCIFMRCTWGHFAGRRTTGLFAIIGRLR